MEHIKTKISEGSLAPTILPSLCNAKTRSGQTPLMLASSQLNYSLIEFLVDRAEVDINVLDNVGKTAISYVLIGLESGILKIPTKPESVDSEIFDVIFSNIHIFHERTLK